MTLSRALLLLLLLVPCARAQDVPPQDPRGNEREDDEPAPDGCTPERVAAERTLRQELAKAGIVAGSEKHGEALDAFWRREEALAGRPVLVGQESTCLGGLESAQPSPRLYRKDAPEAAALNARIDRRLKTDLAADTAAPMSDRFILYVKGSRAPFGVIPYAGDRSETERAELTRLELLGDDVLAAVSPRGTRYYDLRARRLPLEPMGEAAPGRFALAWAAERGGAPKDGPVPHGLLPALAHALRVSGRPPRPADVLASAETALKRRGWPAASTSLRSARFLGDGDIVTLTLDEDGEGQRFQLERGGPLPR